jgi:hypothetical protein
MGCATSRSNGALKDPPTSERAPPDDGALQSRPKEEGSPGNLREEWKRKGSRPCLEMVLVEEDEDRTKKGRRRRSGSNSVSPMSVRSSFTDSPNTPAGLGQFGSLKLRPSNYVKAVEDRLVKVNMLPVLCTACSAFASLVAISSVYFSLCCGPAPLFCIWVALTVRTHAMLTHLPCLCADWQARQGL